MGIAELEVVRDAVLVPILQAEETGEDFAVKSNRIDLNLPASNPDAWDSRECCTRLWLHSAPLARYPYRQSSLWYKFLGLAADSSQQSLTECSQR